MPINVDITELNDGEGGMEATLMRHHASWHKTCRLKYSQIKLERLEKSHERLAHHLQCTHVLNKAQLILQRTNASSVMRKLDLKVSIMPAHIMTLMRRSEAVH